MIFGCITDIHVGQASGNYISSTDEAFTEPHDRYWGSQTGHDNRWYSNGVQRCRDFGLAMKKAGVKTVWELGDLVDAQHTTVTNDDAKNGVDAIRENYTGDMYHVIGNHEFAVFDNHYTNSANDWSLYYDEIGFDKSKLNNKNTDSDWTGDPATSYSVDIDGIHFAVCTGKSVEAGSGVDSTKSWLQEDLDTTDLPIILISHYGSFHDDTFMHINFAFGVIHSPGAQVAGKREVFRLSTEKYNIQGHLSGHIHTAPMLGVPTMIMDQGYPHYPLRSNMITFESTGVARQNEAAYYIFDIEPNSYYKDGRWYADINVQQFNCLGTELNSLPAKKRLIVSNKKDLGDLGPIGFEWDTTVQTSVTVNGSDRVQTWDDQGRNKYQFALKAPVNYSTGDDATNIPPADLQTYAPLYIPSEAAIGNQPCIHFDNDGTSTLRQMACLFPTPTDENPHLRRNPETFFFVLNSVSLHDTTSLPLPSGNFILDSIYGDHCPTLPLIEAQRPSGNGWDEYRRIMNPRTSHDPELMNYSAYSGIVGAQKTWGQVYPNHVDKWEVHALTFASASGLAIDHAGDSRIDYYGNSDRYYINGISDIDSPDHPETGQVVNSHWDTEYYNTLVMGSRGIYSSDNQELHCGNFKIAYFGCVEKACNQDEVRWYTKKLRERFKI